MNHDMHVWFNYVSINTTVHYVAWLIFFSWIFFLNLVFLINQRASGCLLWSLHTGRVPVQWPHLVQFRLAEPDKVKPSLHENSCSSPILNHCFLGQNWPLSNWSCAGQRMSKKVKKKKKIKTVTQRECIKSNHNSYLDFQNLWSSAVRHIQWHTFACGSRHCLAIR